MWSDTCKVSAPTPVVLTACQHRFAALHSVTLYGECRDQSAVCVYHEEPGKTVRWIIDRNGRLLERTEFSRG